MQLKIMSYNIKEGFFDKNKEGDLIHNLERENCAKKIVKRENPDILIINEADFPEDSGGSQNYKKIFGYQYGYIFSQRFENRDFGIGILSKFPIKDSKRLSGKNYRAIKSTIRVRNKDVFIDALHPNPRNSPQEKIEIFGKIIKDENTPCILAGDFNSISPQDSYNKDELAGQFNKKFKDSSKAEKVAKEILEAKEIQFLLDLGLKDTYKEINKKLEYTYHTNLSGNVSMRSDYILCSQDIKVIDSGVVKGPLTEKSSDHYPIYANLEI